MNVFTWVLHLSLQRMRQQHSSAVADISYLLTIMTSVMYGSNIISILVAVFCYSFHHFAWVTQAFNFTLPFFAKLSWVFLVFLS